MTITTTKIDAMTVKELDDLMATLRRRMPAFVDQYDFNIADPKENGDVVDPGQFKDWRDTGRDIVHRIEVLMAETQADAV